MTGRRSLAALIGQHCAPFRRSQRTTLTAQVFGLLMGRRRGLAPRRPRAARPGGGAPFRSELGVGSTFTVSLPLEG